MYAIRSYYAEAMNGVNRFGVDKVGDIGMYCSGVCAVLGDNIHQIPMVDTQFICRPCVDPQGV